MGESGARVLPPLDDGGLCCMGRRRSDRGGKIERRGAAPVLRGTELVRRCMETGFTRDKGAVKSRWQNIAVSMETGFTRDEGAVRSRWQNFVVSMTWKERETSQYVVHNNIDELPKSFL